MKVVIIGKSGEDFPNNKVQDPNFLKGMEHAIRKRLELRPQDQVEFHIDTPPPTPTPPTKSWFEGGSP